MPYAAAALLGILIRPALLLVALQNAGMLRTQTRNLEHFCGHQDPGLKTTLGSVYLMYSDLHTVRDSYMARSL